MRVKAGTVLAVGLIAVGLATALYPFASQWISQSGQQQLIYAQQQLAGQDALEQQMQLAQDYNQRFYQSSVYVRDPFEEQAAQELPQDYEQQLNVLGDGVMGYLQIPAIDLQLPIYHGVTEEVLQKGVGHLPESSLPTGGENTHCVLSAHWSCWSWATGLPSIFWGSSSPMRWTRFKRCCPTSCSRSQFSRARIWLP